MTPRSAHQKRTLPGSYVAYQQITTDTAAHAHVKCQRMAPWGAPSVVFPQVSFEMWASIQACNATASSSYLPNIWTSKTQSDQHQIWSILKQESLEKWALDLQARYLSTLIIFQIWINQLYTNVPKLNQVSSKVGSESIHEWALELQAEFVLCVINVDFRTSAKTKSGAPDQISMQFNSFPLKNQSNNGLQAKS